MKLKILKDENWKRIISLMLVLVMAVTMIQDLPVLAESTTEKYPYMMFAATTTGEAVTIDADSFCANGNIAANAEIVSDASMNINGTKTEYAGEKMIYIAG